MQRRSPNAEAGTGPESPGDATIPVDVRDATERLARGIRTEPVQVLHGVWHQPFAACLVDGQRTSFNSNDFQTCPCGVDRGGQSCRSTTCHKQVDHRSSAKAIFSTVIRLRSSAALSTVNTNAVIHAVCTKGSAVPSSATAT